MTDTINSKSETINEVNAAIMTLFCQKRNELKLNVRELGKKAGVSYTVIYDLEKRNILPKMDTLLKLAEALELTVTLKNTKKDDMLSALSIIFHNEDIKMHEGALKSSKLTTEEQLRKLLNLKGLYADEITEIESYIAFKLSQH